MLARILMTLVLAGLTAVAGAETIYKWMDPSGQIHYTDLPPRQSDAKLLGVFDRQVNELSEEESGEDYSDEDQGDDTTPPSGSTEPAEPAVSEEAAATAQADAEKLRVERCRVATDRYQTYISARRLFKETNGQRVYLTDKELTDARASAKQAVDDYCS